MALNEKQIQTDIKSLKANLQQALAILEDVDLNEGADVSFMSVANFSLQAGKEAAILSGVMKEKR